MPEKKSASYLSPEDELAMWATMVFQMYQIPENYRSRQHTAFLHECEQKEAELAEKLTVSKS